MIAGLFRVICWIIFGAFGVTIVVLFIKLLSEGLSSPKRTTTIHWETENGRKGTLTVESQRIKHPKRKRQRPAWLRFLLEETPATIMERRRREKQRRRSDIE